MHFTRERYTNGSMTLGKNDFLVAARTLKPDKRPVPLYDLFGLPLFLGRLLCSVDEFQRILRLRENQLEEAEQALRGGAFSMTSNVQKLMKRHIEPMMYFTDHSILNPANSTVVMRSKIQPDEIAESMKHVAAYPMPKRNALSTVVLFRPRSFDSEIKGYTPDPATQGAPVSEVTGFQVGQEGLRGNGVKSLTFPRFRERAVRPTTISLS